MKKWPNTSVCDTWTFCPWGCWGSPQQNALLRGTSNISNHKTSNTEADATLVKEARRKEKLVRRGPWRDIVLHFSQNNKFMFLLSRRKPHKIIFMYVSTFKCNIWPKCPSHCSPSGTICKRSKYSGIIYERKEEFILATARKQFKDVYINPWVLLVLRELGLFMVSNLFGGLDSSTHF